jgi:hypothetical protein
MTARVHKTIAMCYTHPKETNMITYRVLSLDERFEINQKSSKLREAGKYEEAMALSKTRPLTPFLARIWKEKLGADALRKSGWNLAEADLEFGPGWLDRKDDVPWWVDEKRKSAKAGRQK